MCRNPDNPGTFHPTRIWSSLAPCLWSASMKYLRPFFRNTCFDSWFLYLVNCPMFVLWYPSRLVLLPTQAKSLTLSGSSSLLSHSSEASSEDKAKMYFPTKIKANQRLQIICHSFYVQSQESLFIWTTTLRTVTDNNNNNDNNNGRTLQSKNMQPGKMLGFFLQNR